MHQHKAPPSGLAPALFVAVLGLWAWPASGLAKPAELSAVAGDGNVKLSWQAVAGATGYQYRQRKAEDVGYNPWAGTTTATSTSHTVTPLHNGTTYSFQVRAVRGADRGPASASATATPFAPCGGESVNGDLAGDCEALLLAKGKLDPGGTLNWSRSRALSEWTGVAMAAGRVTELHCPAGGLANGQLDESLGRLTGLIKLELGDCGLAGAIPSSFGDLVNLETLRAQRNDFSGSLPDLSRLTKLRRLVLFNNEIDGAIPTGLGQLRDLESLYLGGNSFTGAIPAELGNLTKLRGLSIGGAGLDAGPIPAWVAGLTELVELVLVDSNRNGAVPAALGRRLTKLRWLYLGDNSLTDISATASLRNLETLSAHRNEISGSLPDLSRLTKLRRLLLFDNEIDGDIPRWLGQLRDLESLYLGGNSFTGAIPAEIGNLTKLRGLSIGGAGLDAGPIPAWVAGLTELVELVLVDSNRNGAVPAALGRRLTKLRWLYLGDNSLTDISATASLRNLETLSAHRNEISGSLPDLSRLTKLRRLLLFDNEIDGDIPRWLGQLRDLESLYLGGNSFTGAIPAEIGNLTKLRGLSIGGAGLDAGPIPAWVAGLTELVELVLVDSNRNGAVPAALGRRLTKLRWLYLGDNSLTDISATASLRNLEILSAHRNDIFGSLPDLSGLTKLRRLLLFDNEIVGAIPTWLGQLRDLESLYLGGNSFAGAIPAELGNLTKLRGLSIGGAGLTAGPIPAWVAGLTELVELVLVDSNRNGAVPAALGRRLTKLRWLYLGDNSLTDISAVASLRSIETLSAYRNDISGPLPNLSGLTKLRRLLLFDNKIGGAIPKWLGQLRDLESLYLRGNSFAGAIPVELGNLTKLRGLSIDGAGLTAGPIPAWVAGLTELVELSLVNSNRNSVVPDWLGSLPDLGYLHLNNNDLSGNIPAKLGDLTKLVKLSLSGNKLTGCIPSSLASHAATINPQQDGNNLCIQNASGQAPANNAYVFANPMPRHSETTVAHGGRVARAGVPLNSPHGIAGNDGGPLGSFLRMGPWPHAMASQGFSVAPVLLRPVREQRLRASGRSVVLDMRRLFSFSSFSADGFGTRRYVSTSQATALARATTMGNLLILTPNQHGLRGETIVTVTAIERGLGTSARLRVIVQSTPQEPPRRPGD